MAENKKILTFKEINRIDVSEHIEQKMKLSYLSWAWAWQEMKKIDENAEVIVHEFPEYAAVGDTVQTIFKPYLKDVGGAWVKVTVKLNGRSETEYLPVMDMRNKAVVEPDATTINKNIKRCFVKALALHGLGLYIYAGEDIPESEPVKNITSQQAKVLNALIEVVAKLADKTYEEMKAMVLRKQNLNVEVDALNLDQYGTVLNYVNQLRNHYEKTLKEKGKDKEIAVPIKKEVKKEVPVVEPEQESILDRYGNPK